MNDTTAQPPAKQTQIGMDPAYKAGSLIAGVRPYNAQGAHQIIDEIKRQIEAVQSGDMSRGKAMLVAQAEALDVLFYSYLSKAGAAKEIETIAASLALAAKAAEVFQKTLIALRQLNDFAQDGDDGRRSIRRHAPWVETDEVFFKK